MDEGFMLGSPKLVCRWRLSECTLPLENRHLRALSARVANGKHVSNELVAWAKQHIEWTLESGAQAHPDGVLMLVLDEEGRAAMTVGDYHPLEHVSANDLLARAREARHEAESTGVSPEDLWLVRKDTLYWATGTRFAASGACSLINDLAHTLGMPVVRDEELLDECTHVGMNADEVFLVSDEHGVVPASDRAGMRAQKFAASYAKLLSTAKRPRR